MRVSKQNRALAALLFENRFFRAGTWNRTLHPFQPSKIYRYQLQTVAAHCLETQKSVSIVKYPLSAITPILMVAYQDDDTGAYQAILFETYYQREIRDIVQSIASCIPDEGSWPNLNGVALDLPHEFNQLPEPNNMI